MIMELFDCLPLGCIVNGKFLCIHGGISHELQNVICFDIFSCEILLKLIDLKKFQKWGYSAIWFGQILSMIQKEKLKK
jgi:hypothetical protein